MSGTLTKYETLVTKLKEISGVEFAEYRRWRR